MDLTSAGSMEGSIFFRAIFHVDVRERDQLSKAARNVIFCHCLASVVLSSTAVYISDVLLRKLARSIRIYPYDVFRSCGRQRGGPASPGACNVLQLRRQGQVTPDRQGRRILRLGKLQREGRTQPWITWKIWAGKQWQFPRGDRWVCSVWPKDLACFLFCSGW